MLQESQSSASKCCYCPPESWKYAFSTGYHSESSFASSKPGAACLKMFSMQAQYPSDHENGRGADAREHSEIPQSLKCQTHCGSMRLECPAAAELNSEDEKSSAQQRSGCHRDSWLSWGAP